MASDNSAPARYDGFDEMPIAGTWRAGPAGTTAIDTDPYTGETLTEIPLANADDLDEAYATAKKAQREWAARLPSDRADVMRRAARIMEARKDEKDEIVDWHIRESGAAAPAAESEYAITLRDFHEASSYPYRMEGRILPADIEGKESRVYPSGPLPPSSSESFLSPAFSAIPLPTGVHPVKETTRGVGWLTIPSPMSRPAPMTTEHARRQAGLLVDLRQQQAAGARVLDDADLEYAVDAAVFGKFFHQGQVCMITNRIVVDDAVHDEFVDRYVARVRGLKAGDPTEADTVIGPIINAKQLEGIQEKVAQSISDGAEQLLGGLAIANDTEYGLSSAVSPGTPCAG